MLNTSSNPQYFTVEFVVLVFCVGFFHITYQLVQQSAYFLVGKKVLYAKHTYPSTHSPKNPPEHPSGKDS